jgi:hypothetical protein
VGAVAIPLVLVTTLAVVDPPNVPLAPLDGAVNVTVAPLTGLPPLVTVACKAVVKTVLITVLCGVPAVATMAGPPPPCSAAPLISTLPSPAFAEELITQETVRVWPGRPAL